MEAEIRDVHVERYYPTVVANAKEFQQLAEAENPELKGLWVELWRWMLNTFALHLDEAGVKRWEEMLRLRPAAKDTLKERQTVILAKINTIMPYTHRRLQFILDTLYGAGMYEVILDHVKCEIGFRTAPGAPGIARIGALLRPIIPANLGIFMEIVRKIYLHYYIGIIDATIGRKHINLPVVPDAKAKIYSGVAYLIAGRQVVKLPIPPHSRTQAHAGQIFLKTGKITIGGIR